MRGILLALLGLPLVAGFGGLHVWLAVRKNSRRTRRGRRSFTQPATVLRPPGDATFASGWDQTEGATPAATALIGNTRVNVWKWVAPPPPPPPQPPANCCEISVPARRPSLRGINCCRRRSSPLPHAGRRPSSGRS